MVAWRLLEYTCIIRTSYIRKSTPFIFRGKQRFENNSIKYTRDLIYVCVCKRHHTNLFQNQKKSKKKAKKKKIPYPGPCFNRLHITIREKQRLDIGTFAPTTLISIIVHILYLVYAVHVHLFYRLIALCIYLA